MTIRLSGDKKNNSWIIAVIFFFFIHPFLLNISPILSYGIIYGVPLIYLFLKFGYVVRLFSNLLKRQGRFYLAMYFLLFLLTLMIIFFHQSNDYSYFTVLRSVILSLIKYSFLGVIILRNVKEKENVVGYFLHYYIWANVLYVLFSLVLILIPSFKALWFNVIYQNVLYLTEQRIYINRIGINGFAGYRETFACTMGVVFALYLFEKGLQRKKYQYIVKVIICLIGNFLYGRSGLALSVIIILFYILYYRKIRIRNLVVIFGMILALLASARVAAEINPSFNTTIDWATRPFVEIFTEGTTDNYSLDNILHEMVFLPGFRTIMFGSGYYTDPFTGGYYMSTDLGFMRLVLFYGISGVLIVYCMMLSLIKDIGSKSVFLGISILILFIGLEYKGEIWYSLFPLLLLIFMLYNYYNFPKGYLEND